MDTCENLMDALKFTQQVLGGKWKIHILNILYCGKKRFKELEREVVGISPKMLIKELKDLEALNLVNRQTFNTVPITVEYSLTTDAMSLEPLLTELLKWSVSFIKLQENKVKVVA
jgi:DNA-binding HxlR family transcriptional regulator